jgi:type IV secretory pathway VirB10-like protein
MSDRAMDADRSPVALDLSGARAGVKTLNKVPLLVVGCVICVFALGLVYVVNKRAEDQRRALAQEQHPVRDAYQAAQDIIGQAPDGVIPAAVAAPAPAQTPKDPPRPRLREAPPLAPQAPAPVDPELERLLRLQRQRLQDAAFSETDIPGFAGGPPQGANHAQTALPGAEDRLTALKTRIGQLLAAGEAGALEEDPNKQRRKEAFLEQDRETAYLQHLRSDPLTPYEVKAGTVIPAVLITGINSDLPGLITAQVSQHVYDTASGTHLVIPQGTRLVGRYDSEVAYGQQRVLVVWQRLVYPDASTLELETMPGADQAGYAGFHDRVNNHYGKIFGSALLLSLISAGAQLSQPQTNQNINQRDATQTLSAALGQQLGQVGSEVTRRNLNVQPTLEIRPGYRFHVMVNKDIAFTRTYAP